MDRQRPVGERPMAAVVALAALAALVASPCGCAVHEQDSAQPSAGAPASTPVAPVVPAAPAEFRAPESFCFIHFADPQLFWGADALDRWKGAIATANRLGPDFVVVGGDLINADGDPAKRDAAEAERMASAYLDAAAALDPAIPLHNVPGNHDVGNTPTPETYAWYEERFGKLWYSFGHKGSLFIVLESDVLKNPARLPGVAERQLAWVEDVLRDARGKGYLHKVVFMHHPFCLKSIDEKERYENLPKDVRTRLIGLFRTNGVEAVFSGHYHGNARVEAEGIEFITTNAVAKALRGGPPGFRIVKVTPGGIEHAFHSWDDAPARLP